MRVRVYEGRTAPTAAFPDRTDGRAQASGHLVLAMGGLEPAWFTPCDAPGGGPQKSQSAAEPFNGAPVLKKLRRPFALWGSQHPARCRVSRRSRRARISYLGSGTLEFRCVRIITRETTSQGPWVAPSEHRRYG